MTLGIRRTCGWRIVLRIVRTLEIRRGMLRPQWHTENAHWRSRLDLPRYIDRAGSIVRIWEIRRWVTFFLPIETPHAQTNPRLGIRLACGWRIVLTLGIRRAWGWRIVLRIGRRSILDNWASVLYSGCDTPLAMRLCVER